jgi:hypothetical protein
MNDLSVLNRDDREEPVVIGWSTRKNRAVHFVLENHDPKILPVDYVRLTSSETQSVVRFERLYPLTAEVHHAIRDAVHRTGDLDRSFLLQIR